jgi:hypothetical protein
VVDAYKQGKKAYSEVLKVQRELANSNDYLAMRNGLKGVFEMISGVKEEYDAPADGDIAGKVTIANQALAKFGIVIDETMDPDKYMDILG